MLELFNTYSRKARLFPALLCLPPFLLIKLLGIDPFISSSLFHSIFGVVVGNVSLGLVLLYALTQANRFISKALFENKAKFPTTRMLLPSSTDMSVEFRKRLADKVATEFGLALPSKAKELENPGNANVRAREIISMIIAKVGSGKLLLQHNIEYGFVRNLIGGSVISLVASMSGIVLFHFVIRNDLGYILSICFSVFYLMPIVLSRIILTHYGKEYASILFREYMTL